MQISITDRHRLTLMADQNSKETPAQKVAHLVSQMNPAAIKNRQVEIDCDGEFVESMGWKHGDMHEGCLVNVQK